MTKRWGGDKRRPHRHLVSYRLPSNNPLTRFLSSFQTNQRSRSWWSSHRGWPEKERTWSWHARPRANPSTAHTHTHTHWYVHVGWLWLRVCHVEPLYPGPGHTCTEGYDVWLHSTEPLTERRDVLLQAECGADGWRQKAVTKPILIFPAVLRPDISKLPLLDTLSLNWIAAIFFIRTLKWEIWNWPVIIKPQTYSVIFEQVFNYHFFKKGRLKWVNDTQPLGFSYPAICFCFSVAGWWLLQPAGFSTVCPSVEPSRQ